MHVETEIKLKVETHEPIRQRLIAAGAERLGVVLERNAIFDRPEQSLFTAGKGLRVRALLESDGKPGSGGTLTFKGPRRPGRIKSRPEIETRVGNADTTCAILEAIGYVQVLSFEKRRETWTFKGCRVELDELPHLGCHVEIEGPSESAIRTVETALALDSDAAEERTYVAMLIEHCTNTGRSRQDIRLDSASEQR